MRTLRPGFVAAIYVLLQVVQHSQGQGRIGKRYIGYCNSQSSNCGAGCNTGSDCQGGACWASQDTCSTIGYCNSQSSNCGAGCNTNNDCQGGACWAVFDPSTCPTTPTSTGYCNAASTNCGTPCSLQGDCPGGDCWAVFDPSTCPTTPTGYCNAASTNCGTPCGLQRDCPGGDCWQVQQTCPTIPTYTGYCDAASSNCGAGCNVIAECPGGYCKNAQESCGSASGHVIGTYLGALPNGVATPQLSTVPSEVNFVLLGFAKDASYNGNFQQFSEWVNQGVTKQSITADKANNPNRKYMVSLGGAANYGGTFAIKSGMTVTQWVANADASISQIVSDLNADGVDIQFEGGTKNGKFPAAITGLAQRLKKRGYIVSFGPYYGGTWSDYVSLQLSNVDYVFCQFYAKNLQTVASVVSDLTQAKNDLGGWSKLIAGFNSKDRNPNPSVSMQAVEQLKANLKGTFTWAAEHSQYNSPAYCIEKNSARILVDNQAAQPCNW